MEIAVSLAEGFLTMTSIPFVASVLFALISAWLGEIV